MNFVAYGGGTNSTAMLIEMWKRKIPVDLILFADTGAERPETYEYRDLFCEWLVARGLPKIITGRYHNAQGQPQTLEQELLGYRNLPAPCYGGKGCSLKYKISPQDVYLNNYAPCIEVWARGEKVNKYVGYDYGEERRAENAHAYDIVDKKYKKHYPLIEWEIDREDCVQIIKDAGLPLPGKSSCFFCPNMKKREIRQLYRDHPDLFARAVAIEQSARDNLLTVKGLGRTWTWADMIKNESAQIGICEAFDEDSAMPCGCYDG